MIRIFMCILVFGGALFAYVNKQNKITKLRMEIPVLMSELKALEEENVRLQFQVDQFESPAHLLELSKQPEYRHLKHPTQDEIIEIDA